MRLLLVRHAEAVGPGEATVSATTGGVTGSAHLSVTAPPAVASVTLTPTVARMERLQDTVRLTATVRGANGALMPDATVTWHSSAPQHATVDQAGLVTAQTNGHATISAASGGITAHAELDVAAPTVLQLIVATHGAGTDPDGYTVVIDGTSRHATSADQTLRVEGLAPGPHSLGLEDHEPNCYPHPTNPASVDLDEGLVTTAYVEVECLAFPEGLHVTFVQVHIEPVASHLAGILESTGEVIELTSGGFDRSPSWSRDGTRLAFIRDGELMVVGADGRGLRSLGSRAPAAGTRANPDWSPDGTLIAYDDGTNIYIVPVDGQDPGAMLTSGIHPAWSLDGTTLLLEDVGAPGTEGEIFRVDADGSHRLDLTQSPTTLEREPVWSPDGSQIAWRRGIRTDQTGYDLWVMNADGTDPHRVLYLAGAQLQPLWIPADRLLFHDELGIGMVDLDGSQTLTRLTTPPSSLRHISVAWRSGP